MSVDGLAVILAPLHFDQHLIFRMATTGFLISPSVAIFPEAAGAL